MCSAAQMFFEVVPVAALAGLIYAVCRLAYAKKKKAPVSAGDEAARLLFVCYLAGLAGLILAPVNFWTLLWSGHLREEFRWMSGGFNFVPSFYRCLKGELRLGSWTKEMLLGNFLMFVPMGVFLPLVFKKAPARRILAGAAAVSFAVEIVQPAIGRCFDIDDLICNLAGVAFGFLIVHLAGRIARARREGRGRPRPDGGASGM